VREVPRHVNRVLAGSTADLKHHIKPIEMA